MASTEPVTHEPVDRPPADARLHAAWEALRRPDIKVVSTDVFDTLVWRQVAEPVDAFALLGERLRRRGKLAPRLDPGAFQNLRRLAELEGRHRRARDHNDLEVNLDEIYALLPDWVFGSGLGREVAKESELALEWELVVPDLDIVSLLVAATRAGKRVIAVSDTYFSESQMRQLLDQPGLEELELERIFTSSDHRRHKAGGLLEVVLDELDLRPGEVMHLGDSRESDIEPAEELGIKTIFFERHPPALSDLLEREARFAEPRRLGDARVAPELTALRGKVAARAEGSGQPSALRPFWQTGALVLGPVMTGFAEWVQERAAEYGLDRVFCFMREGEFLVPLVERAGAAMGSSVGAERLWLNREVLAAAKIGDAAKEELASLLVRRTAPTVSQFLASVGLGLVDLPGFVSHGETRLDDPVVRENLLDAIDGDQRLRAGISEHARTQRERVLRYVDSLLDGRDRLGVVDLGWGGTAQRLLQETLAQAGRELHVVGLYLLTHEGAVARMVAGMHARGFLGEAGFPPDTSKTIQRMPEILEQLCMPDHGPQVALDDRLQPMLAPAAHDPVQMAEAGALRQGASAFQREWARYRVATPGKIGSLGEAPHLLRPLLLRQLHAPTELEATLLGSWSHDENQGSQGAEQIADSRRAGRLRHLAPDQLRDVPMEELYWPVGLAARHDAATAQLYAAAAAGDVPWEGLSSEVESGPFVIEAAGVDVPPDGRIEEVPRRNRLGLSTLFGDLRASAIHEVVLRPSTAPCVLRMDFLELRCHHQGGAEPHVIRLEAPQDFGRLRRANCFVLNPNVFVVHSGGPELRLDLREEIAQTVFRVDVDTGFALLPISQLLPASGRLRSVEEAGVRLEAVERELEQMRGSLSWRITKPLRLFKRLAR